MCYALVEAVDLDSRAYESGIRRGDVITEIDRAPVSSAAKARAAIEAAKATGQKSVLIYVRNGEGIRFVALKLD